MDSNKDKASGFQVAHKFCAELKHGETCCEIEKEHHRSKFDPSQFDHIATQCRICRQSLRIRTTETWSYKGRQNGAGRHQRFDLEIFMTASMKAAVPLGKDY